MSCTHGMQKVDSIPIIQRNQRSSCKVSCSINIVRTPIVYDEPAQTLNFSNLFSNLTLQHLNGFSHGLFLVLELLSNGDSIFLELTIFSVLQGKRAPKFVHRCKGGNLCSRIFILWN
jgi:hypothetical protein